MALKKQTYRIRPIRSPEAKAKRIARLVREERARRRSLWWDFFFRSLRRTLALKRQARPLQSRQYWALLRHVSNLAARARRVKRKTSFLKRVRSSSKKLRGNKKPYRLAAVELFKILSEKQVASWKYPHYLRTRRKVHAFQQVQLRRMFLLPKIAKRCPYSVKRKQSVKQKYNSVRASRLLSQTRALLRLKIGRSSGVCQTQAQRKYQSALLSLPTKQLEAATLGLTQVLLGRRRRLNSRLASSLAAEWSSTGQKQVSPSVATSSLQDELPKVSVQKHVYTQVEERWRRAAQERAEAEELQISVGSARGGTVFPSLHARVWALFPESLDLAANFRRNVLAQLMAHSTAFFGEFPNQSLDNKLQRARMLRNELLFKRYERKKSEGYTKVLRHQEKLGVFGNFPVPPRSGFLVQRLATLRATSHLRAMRRSRQAEYANSLSLTRQFSLPSRRQRRATARAIRAYKKISKRQQKKIRLGKLRVPAKKLFLGLPKSPSHILKTIVWKQSLGRSTRSVVYAKLAAMQLLLAELIRLELKYKNARPARSVRCSRVMWSGGLGRCRTRRRLALFKRKRCLRTVGKPIRHWLRKSSTSAPSDFMGEFLEVTRKELEVARLKAKVILRPQLREFVRLALRNKTTIKQKKHLQAVNTLRRLRARQQITSTVRSSLIAQQFDSKRLTSIMQVFTELTASSYDEALSGVSSKEDKIPSAQALHVQLQAALRTVRSVLDPLRSELTHRLNFTMPSLSLPIPTAPAVEVVVQSTEQEPSWLDFKHPALRHVAEGALLPLVPRFLDRCGSFVPLEDARSVSSRYLPRYYQKLGKRVRRRLFYNRLAWKRRYFLRRCKILKKFGRYKGKRWKSWRLRVLKRSERRYRRSPRRKFRGSVKRLCFGGRPYSKTFLAQKGKRAVYTDNPDALPEEAPIVVLPAVRLAWKKRLSRSFKMRLKARKRLIQHHTKLRRLRLSTGRVARVEPFFSGPTKKQTRLQRRKLQKRAAACMKIEVRSLAKRVEGFKQTLRQLDHSFANFGWSQRAAQPLASAATPRVLRVLSNTYSRALTLPACKTAQSLDSKVFVRAQQQLAGARHARWLFSQEQYHNLVARQFKNCFTRGVIHNTPRKTQFRISRKTRRKLRLPRRLSRRIRAKLSLKMRSRLCAYASSFRVATGPTAYFDAQGHVEKFSASELTKNFLSEEIDKIRHIRQLVYANKFSKLAKLARLNKLGAYQSLANLDKLVALGQFTQDLKQRILLQLSKDIANTEKVHTIRRARPSKLLTLGAQLIRLQRSRVSRASLPRAPRYSLEQRARKLKKRLYRLSKRTSRLVRRYSKIYAAKRESARSSTIQINPELAKSFVRARPWMQKVLVARAMPNLNYLLGNHEKSYVSSLCQALRPPQPLPGQGHELSSGARLGAQEDYPLSPRMRKKHSTLIRLMLQFAQRRAGSVVMHLRSEHLSSCLEPLPRRRGLRVGGSKPRAISPRPSAFRGGRVKTRPIRAKKPALGAK